MGQFNGEKTVFCTNDPGKMRHPYAKKKKVTLDLCLITYIENEFKMDSRPDIRYKTLRENIEEILHDLG